VNLSRFLILLPLSNLEQSFVVRQWLATTRKEEREEIGDRVINRWLCEKPRRRRAGRPAAAEEPGLSWREMDASMDRQAARLKAAEEDLLYGEAEEKEGIPKPKLRRINNPVEDDEQQRVYEEVVETFSKVTPAQVDHVLRQGAEHTNRNEKPGRVGDIRWNGRHLGLEGGDAELVRDLLRSAGRL
jgi:hypothetical protein